MKRPLFMQFLRNFNNIGSTVQNYLLNDSGSSRGNSVQVRFLLSAPKKHSQVLINIGLEFFIYCEESNLRFFSCGTRRFDATASHLSTAALRFCSLYRPPDALATSPVIGTKKHLLLVGAFL